uniref:Uncharacterized protein n=1 Tax=Vespula pensylvanica TaxID=30213 RepID=A0A834PGP5_VESPE|nr:hypothetical protein H0235_001708 [Vespula pensylvanica]
MKKNPVAHFGDVAPLNPEINEANTILLSLMGDPPIQADPLTRSLESKRACLSQYKFDYSRNKEQLARIAMMLFVGFVSTKSLGTFTTSRSSGKLIVSWARYERVLHLRLKLPSVVCKRVHNVPAVEIYVFLSVSQAKVQHRVTLSSYGFD